MKVHRLKFCSCCQRKLKKKAQTHISIIGAEVRIFEHKLCHRKDLSPISGKFNLWTTSTYIINYHYSKRLLQKPKPYFSPRTSQKSFLSPHSCNHNFHFFAPVAKLYFHSRSFLSYQDYPYLGISAYRIFQYHKELPCTGFSLSQGTSLYKIFHIPYSRTFPVQNFPHSVFQDFPDLIQGFSIFLPPGHRLPTWSVAFFYCPRVLAKCVFTSKMNKWHFPHLICGLFLLCAIFSQMCFYIQKAINGISQINWDCSGVACLDLEEHC